MSKELSVPAKNEIADFIKQRADLFSQLMGSAVDPAPFLTSAIYEVNNMSKPCSVVSVMNAVFNCATLGLMFGKQRGHAYLVPFEVGKNSGKFEAQLIVGYKGFTDLAYRSGWLTSLHTDVVCISEEFEMWTDENGPHFKHKPQPHGRKFDEASIVGAYVQWRNNGSGSGFKFVDQNTIKKARKNTDPWKFYFHEMAMKTAIRRASKLWRQTGNTALDNAVYLEEQAERDETQTPLIDIPKAITEEAAEVDSVTVQEDFLNVDYEQAEDREGQLV